MKKHVIEGNEGRVRPIAIFTPTTTPCAYRHCIDHTGSGPNRKSTSLLLGGMTKARVPELTRIAGSDTFTHSPSFGPEPEVGFGGYQGTKT